jgi:hypothetical protein
MTETRTVYNPPKKMRRRKGTVFRAVCRKRVYTGMAYILLPPVRSPEDRPGRRKRIRPAAPEEAGSRVM